MDAVLINSLNAHGNFCKIMKIEQKHKIDFFLDSGATHMSKSDMCLCRMMKRVDIKDN